MAATCEALIKNAHRAIGAVDIRANLTAEQATYGLEKLQDVILSLPHFGTWIEVETNVDYEAGQNERIAVIGDVAVTITLPQMVVSDRYQLASLPGYNIAVGEYYAAPRDGSRVAAYAQQGTDKSFYAYRADTGKWLSVINLGFSSEIPLNADLHRYLEAYLAVEIAGVYGLSVPDSVGMTYKQGTEAFSQRFLVVPEAKTDRGVQRTLGWWSW